ncbi:MAG: chlorophyll synthesis pathway protein BchC [Pseudomonadota bacterium]
MHALAVVMERPESVALARLALAAPGDDDLVVDIDWSGISTGTEKLLWSGRMPSFPGMGYPLVPGYEAVGRVVAAGRAAGIAEGAAVFVPGAQCFQDAHCLFGGSASRVVVPASRAAPVDDSLGAEAVLLSLAATAHHALQGARLPSLIVGHGVLGRLLARMTVALGGAPRVWEIDAARMDGAIGYRVLHPDDDADRGHDAICEASGAQGVLDRLMPRLAKGGEITLAGFYEEPVAFTFPPAFMAEARLRIAAEFTPEDLAASRQLIAEGRLSLDGLVTHQARAERAETAYETAFSDPACLKMVLDWRNAQ